jgi:hypothetical protein
MADPTHLEEELPFEDTDDAVDEIDRLVKDSHNRLSLTNVRLSESYLNGTMNIHLEIRSRGCSEQYSAFIKALPNHRVLDFNASRPITIVAEKVIGLTHRGRWNELPVPIRSAEAVNGIEQIVPSLVWLKPLYEFNRGLRKLLYRSLVSPTFKYFYSLSNYEIDICVRSAIQNGKRTSELIKGRIEISERIADDSIDIIGRLLFDEELVNFLMVLRIELHNEFRLDLSSPVRDDTFQIADVGVWPF